jgi:hypothetical protein
LVFENCQVEADESVIRKEKVYDHRPDGTKVRTGTIHHSVICLTQRGSTKLLAYLCEPKFVPVAASGKPSAPALPSVELVLPLLSKHFGKWIVFHTDGAAAYTAACKCLQGEGFTVVHDHVVHSKGQWTAFGQHDVSMWDDWEGCDLVSQNADGKRRIRVIKGCQKAEGFWRHLKHGEHSIPEEVHNDDERLNLYVQALVWRMQCIGCPYQEVMRMCRGFRHLPMEQKKLVLQYGLKDEKSKKPVLAKPPVDYCTWSMSEEQEEEQEQEQEE